jgi:hypothetical protein
VRVDGGFSYPPRSEYDVVASTSIGPLFGRRHVPHVSQRCKLPRRITPVLRSESLDLRPLVPSRIVPNITDSASYELAISAYLVGVSASPHEPTEAARPTVQCTLVAQQRKERLTLPRGHIDNQVFKANVVN